MSLELNRLAELAREDPGRRFYSIAHFLNEETLYEAFRSLRKDAAAGVDGLTYAGGTNYVLEIDIAEYFDSIVREQLMAMVEERISDSSILKLIRKWLNVGVIDEGRLLVSDTGTGQGQIISPLLANVYLHHVLDEWFEKEVKPRLRGKAFEVRYADDAVFCFQYREDAQKVLDVLHRRFEKFGLTLHPQKTRLIEFGRQAFWRAQREGRKLETFDFLGFTHLATRSRRGKFTVHVRTMKRRLRRAFREFAAWCREHRHEDVEWQRTRLNAKLRGHYEYYGRATNFRSLQEFYRAVRRAWRKWLNRRTRGKTLTWKTYQQLLDRHPLLLPRITRPWAGAGSRT